MAKILHLDDDVYFLSLMKTGLGKRGHDVITASLPDEAERVLAEGPVDLLILDVMMPECDGKHFFDTLKVKHPNIPVLFCTALQHTFDVSESAENLRRWTEGFSDGLTDIIYKPFTLDQLSRKVESLVDTGMLSP